VAHASVPRTACGPSWCGLRGVPASKHGHRQSWPKSSGLRHVAQRQRCLTTAAEPFIG
jgi:hypothetical protein